MSLKQWLILAAILAAAFSGYMSLKGSKSTAKKFEEWRLNWERGR